MPQYAAIIYTRDVDWTLPEYAEEMAEYGAFAEAAGAIIRGGAALYPTATATTVRVEAKGGDVADHRRAVRRDQGGPHRLLPARVRRPRRGDAGRREDPGRVGRRRRGASRHRVPDVSAVARGGPHAPGDAHRALAELVRVAGRDVLATLARLTGDLALAEDAVQDASLRALETWPRDGVPDNPVAWLRTTARRCAVDLIRREAARGSKEAVASGRSSTRCCPRRTRGPRSSRRPAAARVHLLPPQPRRGDPGGPGPADAVRPRHRGGRPGAPGVRGDDGQAADPRPAEDPAGPHPLPGAVGRRAARPLGHRLATTYLMFNEGYAATAGAELTRPALVAEAVRLTRLLHRLLPDDPGATGLLALMLLQDSRRAARIDADGAAVLLADQDRTQWDRAVIAEGVVLVGEGLRLSPAHPDPYVVQAAIAACHALAPSWGDTDWAAIVSWYDVLLRVDDGPVVRLNRAVAVAEARGPQQGLDLVDAIDGLRDYPLWHATRAALLRRLDRPVEAAAADDRARSLPLNAVQRDLLDR